jgi:hypothetical protein
MGGGFDPVLATEDADQRPSKTGFCLARKASTAAA